MKKFSTALWSCLFSSIFFACGDQRLDSRQPRTGQAAVLNAYSIEPKEYWIGTAPFCNASRHECAALAMDFVREDRTGDGKTCWTGRKVLCRDRRVSWQPPVDDSESFSVVAYNVFLRPAIAGQDGQQERVEHIPSALAQLSRGAPDVVVHVEVFQDQLRARLGEIYGQFAYRHHSRSSLSSSTTVVNGGIALYSRWPIVREAQHIYTRGPFLDGCIGADCLAAKGVVYVAVDKTVGEETQRVHIFATHLQAWNAPQARRVRRGQLEELKGFQASLNIPRDEPVLFAGDFNIDAHGHAEEYLDALAVLQAPAWNSVEGMYSSDPRQSVLVGRDGAAQTGGCNAEYQRAHVCSCCSRELLDFVLHDTEHRAPLEAPEVQVYRPRAPRPFAICTDTGVPMPSNVSAHSQWCRETWQIDDLSDHLAVYVRYRF